MAKPASFLARFRSSDFADSIVTSTINSTFDPLINISALVAIKKEFRDEFNNLINQLDITNEIERKVCISFYVQSVLEMTVLKLCHIYRIYDVILVGGVFMNVKLNNEIAHQVMGRTMIMPLCGDQGAAIGLAAATMPVHWPNHLFWGNRPVIQSPDISEASSDDIMNMLADDKIVNLVRGRMEFGARALGHTSTLALPTPANVAYINRL